MPIHFDLDQILGSTCSVDHAKRRKLDSISIDIAKAKKIIVVSGAGISCSSGIPDFRSENGLYSLVKKRYPDTFVTGKDLFSSGLFKDPRTTSVFLTFIAELSIACQSAQPTPTHHFIQKLDKTGKLLRSYTQNVDGFERRMGMESGGRGKGLSKMNSKNVELHGDLGRVRCVLCQSDYPAKLEWVEEYREGSMPDCPACEERCNERLKRGSRALAIGTLRPAIVLYDEPHPLGDAIGELQAFDLRKGPDVMLIMGTSLKVHGLKNLVKSFAKGIHEKKQKGIVILVNQTKPSKEWDGIIDYHIQGETDRWVERVEEEWKRVKPTDWETQLTLDGPILGQVNESTVKPKASKSKPGPKGKINKKETDNYPILTAGQLPTPRPSRSPSCSDHSGRPIFASSSPLSAPPTPTRETVILQGPPTPSSPPLSPSKRRANMQTPPADQSPTKKSRAPQGKVPPTPGQGNLFAPRLFSQNVGDSEEWEDIIMDKPILSTSTKNVSRVIHKNKGLVGHNEEDVFSDKENTPAKNGNTRKLSTNVTARGKVGTKKLAEVVVGARRRGLRTATN